MTDLNVEERGDQQSSSNSDPERATETSRVIEKGDLVLPPTFSKQSDGCLFIDDVVVVVVVAAVVVAANLFGAKLKRKEYETATRRSNTAGTEKIAA